jgi:hypothetical protein
MHNLIAMRQFRRTSPLTCLMKLREPITLWVTSARIFFVGTPPLLLIDHLLTSLPHHTNNTHISVLRLSDIYSHFHIIHTFTFRGALPQMIYQNCCPCLWTFTLTDPILQDDNEWWSMAQLPFKVQVLKRAILFFKACSSILNVGE